MLFRSVEGGFDLRKAARELTRTVNYTETALRQTETRQGCGAAQGLHGFTRCRAARAAQPRQRADGVDAALSIFWSLKRGIGKKFTDDRSVATTARSEHPQAARYITLKIIPRHCCGAVKSRVFFFRFATVRPRNSSMANVSGSFHDIQRELRAS